MWAVIFELHQCLAPPWLDLSTNITQCLLHIYIYALQIAYIIENNDKAHLYIHLYVDKEKYSSRYNKSCEPPTLTTCQSVCTL